MADWVVAVSTVALVCVTAWYVVLTARLSRSAEASARDSRAATEAARKTADAAADAARAAERTADAMTVAAVAAARGVGAALATLNIDFELTVAYDVDRRLVHCTIRNRGDSVWVHGVKVFLPVGCDDDGKVGWWPQTLPSNNSRRLHAEDTTWATWDPPDDAVPDRMCESTWGAWILYGLTDSDPSEEFYVRDPTYRSR